MGTGTCRKHLLEVKQLLTKFEKDPKEIQGRKITQWFLTGEDIFKKLFELGQRVDWKFSEFKNHSEISEIYSQLSNNSSWLGCFISLYPTFRINLDLVGSADDICKVRSGLDVLLKGFSNITQQFDKVLQNINKEGEVDELDRCLKIWLETGHRPDFKNKPIGLLKDHWWWF